MMRWRRPQLSLRFVSVILGLAAGNGSSAAEWTTAAGVAPGLVYTDNVCLSRDNEQGEWIATLTPDVAVNADGRRANFDVSASVEVNSLSDSRIDDLGCNPQGFGDREQFSPRLNGSADAIVIDGWLFIDAAANINQNSVSPFVSGGDDSLNRTGNTNTVYNYRVSPYISRRFKDAAQFDLRYTWDDQYNTTDVVGDSSQQRWGVSLGSVPGTSKLTWGLQGNYSKVKYDDTPGRETGGDNELKSAQLDLGYQLNRFWQVNGYYGQEWNDFISEEDDIDGDFWDLGLRWTPSERTTIEAGTGDRFFGSTPRFSISQRHKRSELSASYVKTITYDRDIRNPGSDSGGNLSTLSNSPILDERFTLDYSYQGRRSGFGINGSYSDQTRAEDLEESTFKRLSASANRSLSRQLSISCSLSWDEEEPKGDRGGFVQQSETWEANIGARRQLSTNTSLSFDYRYTDRQSDSAFNEYQENRFTLTLRINL